MSYSRIRTEYNNHWPDKQIEFSGQRDFINLYKEKGIDQILKPIKLPVVEDFQFQRLLSFKIDIYEQLPFRPDIGFDLAWRTFEAYSTYFSDLSNWSTTKTWKILKKVSEDILEPQLNNNHNLNNAFETLRDSIPLQACEYLIRRMLEPTTASIKSQQNMIIDRFKDAAGERLYEAVKKKYPSLTPESQRRAGMLLQLIVRGERVEIEGTNFQLCREQILKLLINGILYTYRNERFHGDAFSPFKSSKTRIKTYAHSYYSLITVYFFITILILNDARCPIDASELALSLADNTSRYNLVFSNQIKK